ncbi:MAG: hypothetical protein QF727_06105, partial [Prochlorococcaceae cyanobacterium ETNP14_MAG_4]|nr:hypothetical protein [Prochlorococcaceae cyanobacterium ETNP14_MAG_4]
EILRAPSSKTSVLLLSPDASTMLKVVIALKLVGCNSEDLIASDAHTIAFLSDQSVDIEQSHK